MFLPKKKVPLSEIIPNGYVDIHSHLLSGIDDGVTTVYQSAYIIEQFQKMGFKKIITTPHVMQDVWPNTSQGILDKLEEMREVLRTLNITEIEFTASAEYMMDTHFSTLVEEKNIIPLFQNYILVEMSTFNAPIHLKELLFKIKMAGYIPILAHPERYSFYGGNLNKFMELKESGFLFQMNLLSLSGFYGDIVQQTALKLITEGLIDFTGTDVHNYYHLKILETGFLPKYARKIIPIMENNMKFL